MALANSIGELLCEPPYCAVFSEQDCARLRFELDPVRHLPPKVIRPTPPAPVRG